MNSTLDELIGCFKEYLKLYSLEENVVIKVHLKSIIEEYISSIKSLLDTTFDCVEKKEYWSFGEVFK